MSRELKSTWTAGWGRSKPLDMYLWMVTGNAQFRVMSTM